MTKSQLRKRFKEFTASFIEANPLINYGGCGVFAAEMAKDLTAKGFDATIRVIADPLDAEGFDSLQAMFQRIEGNGGSTADLYEWELAPYHVVLEVKGHGIHGILDAERFAPVRGYEYNGRTMVDGYVPLEIMDDAANYSDMWNSTFPRKTIPKVREAIKEFTEALLND